MKFLIINLKLRKDNDWAVNFFSNEGPKTIDEIHKEHNKELKDIEDRAEKFYEKNNPYNQKSSYVKKEIYYKPKDFQIPNGKLNLFFYFIKKNFFLKMKF